MPPSAWTPWTRRVRAASACEMTLFTWRCGDFRLATSKSCQYWGNLEATLNPADIASANYNPLDGWCEADPRLAAPDVACRGSAIPRKHCICQYLGEQLCGLLLNPSVLGGQRGAFRPCSRICHLGFACLQLRVFWKMHYTERLPKTSEALGC